MIKQKNVHIVKHQDTQKEVVSTLLDCALLVINYVSLNESLSFIYFPFYDQNILI